MPTDEAIDAAEPAVIEEAGGSENRKIHLQSWHQPVLTLGASKLSLMECLGNRERASGVGSVEFFSFLGIRLDLNSTRPSTKSV